MPLAKSENLRKGRVSERGRIYFVTACTYRRQPLFADADVAETLCREFARDDETTPASVLAYVVMPDHAHWLLQLEREAVLASAVKRLKGRSARYVNAHLGRTGQVWQHGYHDHAVRFEERIRDAARYLIHNPVRAGLVGDVEQYPYWDTVWHRRRIRD